MSQPVDPVGPSPESARDRTVGAAVRAALHAPWADESLPRESFLVRVSAEASRARRRRRRVLAGAAAAVVLAGAGAAAAVASGGHAGRARLTPVVGASATPPVTGRAASQAAVITPDGRLELIPLSGDGPAVLVARGAPYVQGMPAPEGSLSSPAFSHDGRYLSWLVSQPNGLSRVEIAAVATPSQHRTVSTVALQAAWSPTADELAVTSDPGLATDSLVSDSRVALVSPAGQRLTSWRLPADPTGLALSPNGRWLAVGGRAGLLALLPTAGGRATDLAGIPRGDCAEPAGWTADSSRVLVWDDEMCSSSLAADGLPLESIGLDGGARIELGLMLPYPSWVVPETGASVLLDLGGDRMVADHKHIERCDAATGTCTPLAGGSGLTALDPALDPGLAAAARGCLTGAPGRCPVLFATLPSSTEEPNAGLAPAGLGESLDGTITLVRAAGTDVADPEPDPAASGSVLFFRVLPDDTTMRLERIELSTGNVTALATLSASDYYGHIAVGATEAVWGGLPAGG